ncbi:hypothetical protein NY547_00010 [Cnuibacter physcomitrellae]|uniref:hypothetical protein n=1 Tax=Cnuibacter physcomitrellae TaxID=1619308 RepID=UPI002175E240|nr:hypothetical protein [Cnuibacter physcomitrellae]MCS5495620.1 hypothetical protein [Cnuibacter physcomitrellae]
MRTEHPGPQSPLLDYGFVTASTFITGGLAFVASQVAMVIATRGDLSFWGFAIMGSGILAIAEWVGVFAGGMLVLSLKKRRPGHRWGWALIAGGVCGLTAGGAVLLALLVFGVVQAWPLAALSIPVAGVVSGVSAFFVRASPPKALLSQRLDLS